MIVDWNDEEVVSHDHYSIVEQPTSDPYEVEALLQYKQGLSDDIEHIVEHIGDLHLMMVVAVERQSLHIILSGKPAVMQLCAVDIEAASQSVQLFTSYWIDSILFNVVI